jgi:hypothetical protein
MNSGCAPMKIRNGHHQTENEIRVPAQLKFGMGLDLSYPWYGISPASHSVRHSVLLKRPSPLQPSMVVGLVSGTGAGLVVRSTATACSALLACFVSNGSVVYRPRLSSHARCQRWCLPMRLAVGAGRICEHRVDLLNLSPREAILV